MASLAIGGVRPLLLLRAFSEAVMCWTCNPAVSIRPRQQEHFGLQHSHSSAHCTMSVPTTARPCTAVYQPYSQQLGTYEHTARQQRGAINVRSRLVTLGRHRRVVERGATPEA